ncbi:MucR family transcriptional regulator, partial [bacterium]|nr:MucR family transcriptional regulator [bacterium]
MRHRKDPYAKERRQIIQSIRNLHRLGEPLNMHAVKRLHPDLIRKVYSVQPFWGWAQAVAAAGLNYRKIRIHLLETVTCQICGKEFKSLTMHLPRHEVSTEEYQRSFPGEWLQSEALRAARSDSLLSRNPLMEHWEPLWSEKYILDRIHEFYRRGIPVNSGYIHRKDRAFEAVAEKYFGSWDEALRKAGVNPESTRLQDHRIVYDRKDVIRELRKRHGSGRPLNHAAVQFEDLRLCNAARRLFESYSAALAAAGIDPTKVRLVHQPYDRADRNNLLKAIQKVASIPQGRRRTEAIRSLRKKYEKMVKRLFRSSWTLAASTAGVPYRAIHPRDHRDFSDLSNVIRALKDRLKAGKSLVSYL